MNSKFYDLKEPTFFIHFDVSFSATTTTGLRSCWMGAGQCSGSRSPPRGFVSCSTWGLSLLPSSAPSALRPRTQDTALTLVSSDFLVLRWRRVALRLSQGTSDFFFSFSSTFNHWPLLSSTLELEEHPMPFMTQGANVFVNAVYTLLVFLFQFLFLFTITVPGRFVTFLFKSHANWISCGPCVQISLISAPSLLTLHYIWRFSTVWVLYLFPLILDSCVINL